MNICKKRRKKKKKRSDISDKEYKLMEDCLLFVCQIMHFLKPD